VVRKLEVSRGRLSIEEDRDSISRIIHKLASLRSQFVDPRVSDEEKHGIASEYTALVTSLPSDIQPYHRGLVGGNVVGAAKSK